MSALDTNGILRPGLCRSALFGINWLRRQNYLGINQFSGGHSKARLLPATSHLVAQHDIKNPLLFTRMWGFLQVARAIAREQTQCNGVPVWHNISEGNELNNYVLARRDNLKHI